MKRYILFCAMCVLGTMHLAHAQLPGPGNIDWITKWEKLQPATYNASDTNAWMYGDRMYTGLAYDTTRNILYVVCPDGNGSRILMFEKDAGTYVGDFPMDTTIVRGGHEAGKFAIYKIAVDQEGRIYACNIVSPQSPGDGPLRIYRWDTPTSSPQLLYEYTPPATTDLIGTALDATGKRYYINGAWHDSVRVFTVTASLDSTSGDDQLLVFEADTLPNAPYPLCHTLTIDNPNPGSVRYFGAGVAVTGSSQTSTIMVSSQNGNLWGIRQSRPGGALPQTIGITTLDTVPGNVSGLCGPIATGVYTPYFPPEYRRLFVVCGNAIPSSTNPADTNLYTCVQVAKQDMLHSWPAPIWNKMPSTGTPMLGMRVPALLQGTRNWIADIDCGWYPTPDTANQLSFSQYRQVFYLLSNNGIGCWVQRYPDGPVELSSFTAMVESGAVQLTWITASETNNYGFYVERSIGGGAYETLGFVQGRGTTSTQQEYAYTDPVTLLHEQAGVVQYHLKQTDYDGTYEYSPVVSLTLGEAPSTTWLGQNYPNPFTGATSISYSIPSEQYITLDVYDMLGRRVQSLYDGYQESGMHSATFDAGTLPEGLYICTLRTQTARLHRTLVVRK